MTPTQGALRNLAIALIGTIPGFLLAGLEGIVIWFIGLIAGIEIVIHSTTIFDPTKYEPVVSERVEHVYSKRVGDILAVRNRWGKLEAKVDLLPKTEREKARWVPADVLQKTDRSVEAEVNR